MKLFSALILTGVLLPSCVGGGTQRSDVASQDIYNMSLIEKRLGESRFYISLPDDFVIEIMDAEDFVVYHFRHGDSTAMKKIFGGIYFGNHPSYPIYKCSKEEPLKSNVLNKARDWSTYRCDSIFSAETLLKNRGGEYWEEYIHLFGTTSTRDNLDELLKIYSTLRKE